MPIVSSNSGVDLRSLQTLGFILKTFGIAEAIRVQQPLGSPRRAYIWKLECADGTTYVVRQHHRHDLTRQVIARLHQFILFVGSRTTLVRRPLIDKNGSSVIEVNGVLYSVFPYVFGEAGSLSSGTRISAAKNLAQFHSCSRLFHSSWSTEISRESLASLGHLFSSESRDSPLAKLISTARLAEIASRASSRLAILPPGPIAICVVHGDFHPENVITISDSVTSFIDYDSLRRTERSYDIAVGMDTFSISRNSSMINWKNAISFVQNYHARDSLSPIEWRMLPDLIIRRNLLVIWWIASRAGSTLTDSSKESIMRHAGRALHAASFATENLLSVDTTD